ncbi:hypothetical protein Golob_005709, partial [Gossypium lobatum]|nr:hypothetical protein [Gossypium lobatum]
MAQMIEWSGSITSMASTPLSPPIRGFFSNMWVLDFSRDCPKCGASVETLVHALKDRQTARTILTLGVLDGRLLNKDYPYCIDWIEDVICFLDKKVVVDFITTLSDSWNNRNNYVFRGKEEEARVIWDRAKLFPLCRTVKINFDVIVFNNKTCFGVIVCNSNGFVLGGGGDFKEEDMAVEWAELYAFEEGFKIVRSLNIASAIFETNCASLVNKVKNHKEDITII